jgi:hypothetical protein
LIQRASGERTLREELPAEGELERVINAALNGFFKTFTNGSPTPLHPRSAFASIRFSSCLSRRLFSAAGSKEERRQQRAEDARVSVHSFLESTITSRRLVEAVNSGGNADCWREYEPMEIDGKAVSLLRYNKYIIERSRFAGWLCSGSVKESIDVRCQSAVTRPRYDTTATKIHS